MVMRDRNEARFMAPELEQLLVRAHRPQQVAVVFTESREEWKFLAAHEHIYRVDLNEPDVVEHLSAVTFVDLSLRARFGKALRGDGDTARRSKRQRGSGFDHGRLTLRGYGEQRVEPLGVAQRMMSGSEQARKSIADRKRIIGTLMATAALGGLGQLIGLTVAGPLVKDLLHGNKWVGTANAASSVGTAVGSLTLAKWMQRRGRRYGLVLGYAIGMVGSAIVVLAAHGRSYWLLLVGLLLFGVANTSNQQSRFAAADVTTSERRARTVGLVVWASTIGVVLGPKVAGPAGRWFSKLGNGEYGGAFVIAAAGFLLAAVVMFVLLHPEPLDIARELNPVAADAPTPIVDVWACLRRRPVQIAIGTLVANQVVMVAIMSVTNVHLIDHGYTLGGVGTVLSGHVFGMFAPSPIIGWLCDRVGRITVIIGSCFVMITAALFAANANPASHNAMIAALFLLGVGWNGNFVAGSALVTDAVSSVERPRLQGITDLLTYAASAVAALSAGLLVGTTGYPTMALVSMSIALLLLVIVFIFRSTAIAVAVPVPIATSASTI
jgi:MFS family permease